jgi:putative hydrolase of the HAD superfamily
MIASDAVLLDAYGTLLEPDWPRLTAGRDAIADHMGVSRRAAHEAWAATHRNRMRGASGSLEGDLAAVFAAARSSGAQLLGDVLLADLAALERANWSAGVRLYPDVLPTLERLRDGGIQLAIVTNASAEAAEVITRLGLDQFVELVLASCDVGVLKPALLGLALGRLGVEPRDATLVDDELGEVLAARDMGMNATLLRRGPSGTRMAGVGSGGAAVTDLAELAELIFAAPSGRRGGRQRTAQRSHPR